MHPLKLASRLGKQANLINDLAVEDVFLQYDSKRIVGWHLVLDALLRSLFQLSGTNHLVELVLELLHGVLALLVLDDGLLFHEGCPVLEELGDVVVDLDLGDVVLLDPVLNEDLVDFEANGLHENDLVDLAMVRITVADHLIAKPDQLQHC